MDIKQHNVDKNVKWEYFPDTVTINNYLDSEDLVELSKCSKLYRKQFEQHVFEYLDLSTWRSNNGDIYDELIDSKNLKKVLEFMKTDLGSKLKFVNEFTLFCEVDSIFAEIFVKLLPNIKTLNLFGNYDSDYLLEKGLENIIISMEHLEHLSFFNFMELSNEVDISSANRQIIPKSLKSLEIDMHRDYAFKDGGLAFFDTIDTSYVNLYFLTIVSNRMLENLSSGMPSLKKVEIINYGGLDKSKILEFLTSNQQLKKLSTRFVNYSSQVIKTLVSSKYLDHWCIARGSWKGIEVNNLPYNYSIKNLEFHFRVSAPLAMKIIKACKGLYSLEIYYQTFNKLNWSEFDGRINVLKLSWGVPTLKAIDEIDNSKVFNQVYLDFYSSIEKFVEKCNIDKLKNYKIIPSTLKYRTIKLINITD